MILYGLVKERIEERRRRREAIGAARGEAIVRELVEELGEARCRKLGEAIVRELVRELGEARCRKLGETIGEAIGRELERREWMAWNARRKAAEAAGEVFIEPNPAEKHDSASRNQG